MLKRFRLSCYKENLEWKVMLRASCVRDEGRKTFIMPVSSAEVGEGNVKLSEGIVQCILKIPILSSLKHNLYYLCVKGNMVI